MSEWQSRFEVARWEFQRFVKPKQMVVSFVIMFLMGGVGFAVSSFAKRANTKPREVAVIGGAALGIDRSRVDNVDLTPALPADMDSLRVLLTSRKLDGILVVESADSARLIVRRNPVWKRAVEMHLASARQGLRLREAGLAPDRLAAILSPVSVTTEFQSGNDGRLARVAAFLAVGFVIYGVFSSMAYLLVSVTAEKQLRVTEQVISAISPQTWMDGKIIGIAGVALVNVLLLIMGAALWLVGRSIATGTPFTMGTIEPVALLWIILFAMLGFVFWISMFGVVAATIDDPNSSTRGPLMFLPAVFSFPGIWVIANPDSTFARVVGQLPLTSAAVMPARLALTEVPIWELLLSAALLLGGALLARRAAGRVFAVAMLMYGKEPSWGEVRRWAREA